MKRKRKRHSAETKAKVAVEALRGLRPLNEIASEYGAVSGTDYGLR